MAEKQKNNLPQFGFLKPGKTAWLVLFFAVFLLSLYIPAKPAQAAVWDYQGIAFYAYNKTQTDTVPVYRFRNKSVDDHSYTISEKEKSSFINNPAAGYVYQGVAFYGFREQVEGSVPVYSFRNKEKSDHVYTISEKEKGSFINNPAAGYVYQGVVFYEFNAQVEGSVPAYRFRNKAVSDHVYTTSEKEKDLLLYPGLGQEISVGVWNYSRSALQADSFEIEANENYVMRDRNGKLIATLAGNVITKVKYDTDGNIKVYNSIPEKILDKEVTFESAKAGSGTIIFNAHRPDSSYDEYRGKMKVRYGDTSKLIWVINILPLEHYVWGIGEITGTGDEDYNRTMTTAFRTYGYWKILYSTKYAIDGFKVDATSASQIYRGYEWEVAYPRIKAAAIYTQGKIAKYGSDIALTPFSSWTDGRTRSFEERWGSKAYPWCQSVADPYGKHATMTTAQLLAAGNHMVGISAHGALKLATTYNWAWDRILKYYLTGITITKIY